MNWYPDPARKFWIRLIRSFKSRIRSSELVLGFSDPHWCSKISFDFCEICGYGKNVRQQILSQALLLLLLAVLRIRSKSFGSGFGSGSGLKIVSDPDSNPGFKS
jgi:hypothetical protein